MARSRATVSGAAARVVVRVGAPLRRGERVHLSAEGVDARMQTGRLALAEYEDGRADGGDQHGGDEEPDRTHGRAASGTSVAATRSWPSRPHASPPSHVSFFQIGTVALTASMAKRAAANASGRCGVDTA